MNNPRLYLNGESRTAKELASHFSDRIRKAAEKIRKAGADQESAGQFTMPTGKQAKREYDDSFSRQPSGVGGNETPDLPERGRDWHGTVAGVPDENQEPSDEEGGDESENPTQDGVQKVWQNPTIPFEPADAAQPPTEGQPPAEGQPPIEQQQQPVEQASAVKSLTDAAIKAFAGAPRFAQGPLVPPREKAWLLTQGYSPDEIASGQVQVTPRMRGEFNRWLQNTVRKSLEGLRVWR